MDQSSFTFLLIYGIYCESLDEESSGLSSSEFAEQYTLVLWTAGIKTSSNDWPCNTARMGDVRYRMCISADMSRAYWWTFYYFFKGHLSATQNQILKGIYSGRKWELH